MATISDPDRSGSHAALRERLAGMSEDEIVAGLRDGSIDTGAVLDLLIESGRIELPAPGGPTYSAEQVAAELGIDL